MVEIASDAGGLKRRRRRGPSGRDGKPEVPAQIVVAADPLFGDPKPAV